MLGQDGQIIRNYLCPWCTQTFTHRQQFINHGVARHVTLNSFFCLICDNGFKSQTALNLHMSVHNDGRAYCKVCHQEFITKASVQEHAINYPPEKDFNCTNCKAVYHTDMQLQAHIEKEHHTEYRCFSCEKLFEDTSALSVHVVTHNGDSCTKFQCEYCGKLHNTRRQQRHHVNMKHLGKEQRVCEFCGKILATNMTLKEHLRTHTGEKPEICNKCGKTFRRKVTLLNHFLTHTGEKPHQCTHCKKSFTQRHTLVIHLRTHTGERPYECSICGEKFASLQPMKLHKKAKHNMLQF